MANASKFLDKRFKLTTGKYKVRIRVTHERKSILLNTKYSFTEDEYKKIINGKNMNNNEDLQKAKADLERIENHANKIIKDLPQFDFILFKTKFEQKGDRSDLITLLYERSKEFSELNKFSSASLYKQTAEIFKVYAKEVNKSEKLSIGTLTATELKNFEVWALNQENKQKKPKYSPTTISMYLIRVRTIINSLINKGEFNAVLYPFGKGKYQAPKALNNKRALTVNEINSIYNYKALNDNTSFAKDMFMFSYLANGMNLTDVFNLKRSDFEKEIFTFIRKKTTESHPSKITVLLTAELQEIIDKNSRNILGSDYLFPIIKSTFTPIETHNAIRKAISKIDVSLKVIAKHLDLTPNLSTYFARHSYATNLMTADAPIAFISKKLGHADLKTTQNYLSQFDDKTEKEFSVSNLLKKA